MKVFLSWSGEKSHKVATIFRDWLPSVIQSLYPYVSSEDIDKGARWSTDIAKELEDATFGILCVTKENINAPWLNFEAGALSKTIDNTFVSPFLFDIKRSEVDGPILQFQSTIFERDDILKLIRTINKACGEEMLHDERLNKAFEVWYPTLEKSLDALKSCESPLEDSNPEIIHDSSILEEILDLSRSNQKLLRNPDVEVSKEISEIKSAITNMIERQDRELLRKKRRQKLHPGMLEEISSVYPRNSYASIQIVLSLFKDDFPWIYDAGIETVRILKSARSRSEKDEALESFIRLVEFSFEHPIMREFALSDKYQYMMIKELPFFFKRAMMTE